MTIESVKITGTVEAILTGPDGTVKSSQVSNLLLDGGKVALAGRLLATTAAAAPSHIELGSGSTAAAAGNTATETVIAGSRLAVSETTVQGVLAGDTAQFTATWAPGVTTSSIIREAGLFNHATAGTMIARTVFSNVIDKGAEDSLTLNWKIRVA